MTDTEHYGLLARFKTPEDLQVAVETLRGEGVGSIEAFTPYPVEGLAEKLGHRSKRVFIASFIAAVVGGALTYAMQWYSAVISFRYVAGGKAFHSWPAFLPATFAVLILMAVLGAVFAMLVGNRFPRPYHPAFNVPDFVHASEDGFFLLIAASDPDYDQNRLSLRLVQLQALELHEVPA